MRLRAVPPEPEAAANRSKTNNSNGQRPQWQNFRYELVGDSCVFVLSGRSGVFKLVKTTRPRHWELRDQTGQRVAGVRASRVLPYVTILSKNSNKPFASVSFDAIGDRDDWPLPDQNGWLRWSRAHGSLLRVSTKTTHMLPLAQITHTSANQGKHAFELRVCSEIYTNETLLVLTLCTAFIAEYKWSAPKLLEMQMLHSALVGEFSSYFAEMLLAAAHQQLLKGKGRSCG